MPVGFEEYFLRQVECPAAVAREAEAPGSHACLITVEEFAEKPVAATHRRITEDQHHFLIRETFRTFLSHAIELGMNGGLSWHARIIVAARFLCREGLVKRL